MEFKASSDGRGALTHPSRMMVDLESSFNGSGALTHRMMADMQRRANVPSEVMERDPRAPVQVREVRTEYAVALDEIQTGY